VWNHSPLAFAVTLTFYDQATGYILDSDIVFNRNYNFFSQPSQLTPDRIDIRYVMLHENGHVAGLDHSGDPSAVMNVQFMPGVVGHGLASDDIDAISTLYPATSNFPPAILMEQNSSNAAAFDSVTFVRGPFSILTPNNFSADGHRRIIFFTSNLKLAQQQNPDASVISVQASGVPLMVENVGPLTGVAGLNASFIVVRLPDQLTPGTKDLTVTLRGTTSTATTFAVQ
jgi:matrixin